MLPIADHIRDDLFRVYFCSRDEEGRSMVGYIEIDIRDPHNILKVSEEPVFRFGPLGHFDDNGVSPSSIVNVDGRKYLYYIGWKPRSTTRFGLIGGLTISDDGGENFQRVSNAPILRCTDKEPVTILTAPFVIRDDGLWRMWYVSGVKWINPDLPVYNIKHASSDDGVNWEQSGVVCIDNRDDETSLARPCVLKEDGIYKMWYSYKYKGNPYRIGYAESEDGIAWERKDDDAGIDVSESGWDSEMVEYAYVFNHKGEKYMLYNGNGYGKNGFGLAVLESSVGESR